MKNNQILWIQSMNANNQVRAHLLLSFFSFFSSLSKTTECGETYEF